jgi:hypothetical protein
MQSLQDALLILASGRIVTTNDTNSLAHLEIITAPAARHLRAALVTDRAVGRVKFRLAGGFDRAIAVETATLIRSGLSLNLVFLCHPEH